MWQVKFQIFVTLLCLLQWISVQALNGYINPIYVTGGDRRSKYLNDYSDHLYNSYLSRGGINPALFNDYSYDLYRRGPATYDYQYRRQPDTRYYDDYETRRYREDYRTTYPQYVQDYRDIRYPSGSMQPTVATHSNQPVVNIPAARSTTITTPIH